MSNEIFKELHSKYHDLKMVNNSNNGSNIQNKQMNEFYKSNKSNISLILTKLIDFYGKIHRNCVNFQDMLKDYFKFAKNTEVYIH